MIEAPLPARSGAPNDTAKLIAGGDNSTSVSTGKASPAAEFFRRARPIKAAHLVLLFELGVMPDDLRSAGGIRTARVRFAGAGFEWDDESGVAAFISPCWTPQWCGDALGWSVEMVDAVAWRPDRPRTFARLAGVAWCLGEDAVMAARHGASLRVLRTPLAWLQAGAEGCVVLDRQRAWPELLSVRRLIADDDAHARDLRALAQPPAWRGRVDVARQLEGAAA
jgi:hypothetical protein